MKIKIVNPLNSLSKQNNLIKKVRSEAITYLDEEALRDLFVTVKSIERKGSEGILIEAGCALGGSAIVIAKAKSNNRPFFVYDVFGMIPPPSMKDDEDVQKRYKEIKSGKSVGLGGNKYYGYEEDLYHKVIDNFKRYNLNPSVCNINFVKGLFQEKLEVNANVALAHIDGDWFESVMVCLERIVPKLVSGGVLIIDDYNDWSGCRKAVDEYFMDKMNNFNFINKSRLHIVKK